MNRLINAASIVMFILAGCAVAAPTAAPTLTARPSVTIGPTQPPAPTATLSPATPSPAPDAARALPTTEDLEAGRYFLEFGGFRFTFTVADPGWIADVGFGAVYQGDDPELAIFWPGGEISSLYGRACQSSGTEFEPGPTVDDLAEALASLEDFEATAPADVTVSGYQGKRIAISVPMEVNVNSATCDRGNYSLNEGRWFQAPGQTDDMRILDLGGERQTVTTSTTPATPADVVAQLDAMVESLVIEPIPGVVAPSASPGASGPTIGARPLLVDTDVAPDDIVAIAFLLASPQVEVKAITVSGTGEAHCGSGIDVVLRLLERLAAPAIDVACGRETPIAGDHAFPDAWRQGVDAGSGLALPSTSRQPFAGTAVELIAKTAQDVDGLRVLTLGPMTTLADAFDSSPDLAQRLESVYAMGGALFVPGNVSFGGPPDNEVAEWNIYVDPAAAQAVIDSGLTVRLISLDGTSQVPVTEEFVQRVWQEAAAPGAQVLAELFAEHPFMTDGSYFLWDPLAAALAADYPLGSFSAARVDVEEAEGAEVGFTRPIEGSPNVEYLSSADRAAAEDTLLETLNR